jgi:hypothetical protein
MSTWAMVDSLEDAVVDTIQLIRKPRESPQDHVARKLFGYNLHMKPRK